MADPNDAVGFLCFLEDSAAFRFSGCDRFFKQDIIAFVEGGKAGFGMQVIRGGDDHGIREFIHCQYLLPIIEQHGLGDAMFVGYQVTSALLRICNGNNAQLVRVYPGEFGVYRATVSCTNEDSGNRLVEFFVLRVKKYVLVQSEEFSYLVPEQGGGFRQEIERAQDLSRGYELPERHVQYLFLQIYLLLSRKPGTS
jgi:hypothetical protein